ncbi:MAG: class B sortase [Oscillospiraceae bacterium]|nr:class B sortase [Oscillospiraceae bacterium]
MRAARSLLRLLNTLLTWVEILLMLLAAFYSIYALWDNRQIHETAEAVQNSLLAYRPSGEETEESGPGFRELQALNPDVRSWLSLTGTKIDYPVLQGTSNRTYLNTDVYGEYALAGSIFLDSRNAGDFSDPYSLVYGHNMENSRMFGDLAKYRNRNFFDENREGVLLLPGGEYRLRILACLEMKADESLFFDPGENGWDNMALLDYAAENAVQADRELLAYTAQRPDCRLLALASCAVGGTDLRTVVLTLMEEVL